MQNSQQQPGQICGFCVIKTTKKMICMLQHKQLPVMLAESQLQAFSVARRLVMFSDVVRTCRKWKSRRLFWVV